MRPKYGTFLESIQITWRFGGRRTRASGVLLEALVRRQRQMCIRDRVMVVANARLVARHGARRADASHQTRRRQSAEHVVDGLLGHLAEILTYDSDDRIRVGMRMVVHRGQHRNPRARHAQGGPAQYALEFCGRRHTPEYATILESVQFMIANYT